MHYSTIFEISKSAKSAKLLYVKILVHKPCSLLASLFIL